MFKKGGNIFLLYCLGAQAPQIASSLPHRRSNRTLRPCNLTHTPLPNPLPCLNVVFNITKVQTPPYIFPNHLPQPAEAAGAAISQNHTVSGS